MEYFKTDLFFPFKLTLNIWWYFFCCAKKIVVLISYCCNSIL